MRAIRHQNCKELDIVTNSVSEPYGVAALPKTKGSFGRLLPDKFLPKWIFVDWSALAWQANRSVLLSLDIWQIVWPKVWVICPTWWRMRKAQDTWQKSHFFCFTSKITELAGWWWCYIVTIILKFHVRNWTYSGDGKTWRHNLQCFLLAFFFETVLIFRSLAGMF